MRFLYSLGIKLYFSIAWLIKWRNQKTKDFVFGHSNKTALKLAPNTRKRVWFHISSLGEYEQAKPVIKGLVNDFEIVITFFSPSGYEAKNVREFTEHVFYLGKDSKKQAQLNIKAIDPDLFVLVKYDFWLNHLTELKRAKVNTIIISGLFKPEQVFFKWYGGIFRNAIKGMKHLFLQNEESAKLLKSIGIENTTVNGDTRVDSVLENVPIALEMLPKEVKDFAKGHKCLVVGSSYVAEEQIVADNLNDCLKDWKIIIAPHNIQEKHLSEIRALFGSSVTFLSTAKSKFCETQVLVVDQIGLLKYLYAVADVAFVGGGFGKTVHNTLEPAAFGISIIFGPSYNKFIEAVSLLHNKGAFSFFSQAELLQTLKHLSNHDNYKKSCNASNKYITENKDASIKVVDKIRHLLGKKCNC